MYWYCPRSNSKNDPEIPGRIIAHIAIIPEKNITIKLWFAAIGFKPTKMYDNTIPITVVIISLKFNQSSLVYRIYADARINPKKNANMFAVCATSR